MGDEEYIRDTAVAAAAARACSLAYLVLAALAATCVAARLLTVAV